MPITAQWLHGSGEVPVHGPLVANVEIVSRGQFVMIFEFRSESHVVRWNGMTSSRRATSIWLT